MSDTSLILDRASFESMSLTQRQRYYAEYGFVLLPRIVPPALIERVLAEEGGQERYDYIERWPGPALEEMVANPDLLGLLRLLYGDDLRFFKSVYAEWRRADDKKRAMGRQMLHRDYNPDPPDGDYRNSCASWCNVGHYLVDLDVDEGPLWVVPGSHRLDWSHGRGDLEGFAPDARMVLARAGDAVVFHNRTMHAGGLMRSGRPRPSVFQSYRPAWAAPLGTVPEWPAEVVEGASAALRPLLAGLNDGVRVDAYGLIRG